MATRTRLESWKQIAGYLDCSERTARRYEQIGLPVYRVGARDRQRVFAYAEELEHWRHEGRGITPMGLPHHLNDEGPPAPGSGAENSPTLRTAAASNLPTLSAGNGWSVSKTEEVIRPLDFLLQMEVTGGAAAGSRFVVSDRGAVLGRDAAADVILPDPQVSRRHLLISRSAAGFEAHDLGSRNGVRLNDRPLCQGTLLTNADRIELGVGVTLLVHLIQTGDTEEAPG